MNFGRCLEILELESAESLEEVKRAYKDLVNVWHPDRFSHHPRLKQKAEDKIREINAAYAQLKAFFNQMPYKIDGASVHNGDSHFKTGEDPNSIEEEPVRTSARGTGIAPGADSPRRGPAVARSSSLGKYVMLAMLLAFALMTVLIIHFLKRTDDTADIIINKAMTAVKEKLDEFERSLPGSEPAGDPQNEDTAGSQPAILDRPATATAAPPAQCIIYLKSGEYIIAEKWWREGEMVEYKIKHGVVGIEAHRIKEIRCE